MMLEVDGLAAAYGPAAALHGVSFRVAEGEVVTLLGRNGMGKTTAVRAVTGLLPSVGGCATAGRVLVAGASVLGWPAHAIARRGLGLVPEGRRVFSTLSVRENLVATARPGRWTLDAAYALFPRLREREANLGRNLSGGEQQMLAIARALLTNPRLLILDEATEGLAPLVRAEIWAVLARLKREGQGILLIDKHLAQVLRLADRHVVIERGRSVWTGTSAELEAVPEIRERHLHV